MRGSRGAVEVVDLNRRVIGRLPRGEYSTDMFSRTLLDTLAAKVEQGPTQRK